MSVKYRYICIVYICIEGLKVVEVLDGIHGGGWFSSSGPFYITCSCSPTFIGKSMRNGAWMVVAVGGGGRGSGGLTVG